MTQKEPCSSRNRWIARASVGRARSGRTARPVVGGDRITLPADVNDEIATVLLSFDQQRDDEAMNEFVRPFAAKFLVSMVAMRIRLERLGLLHREVPRQRSLAADI